MPARVSEARGRIAAIGGLVALHLTVYYTVNAVNVGRLPAAFFSVWTPADDWIPYLGWTAVIYYGGDLYVILGGAWILWHLERGFGRAVAAYAAMIVAGAVVQLALPVEAPFPADLSSLQSFVHEALHVEPYATFPSMHVALAVLPALLAPQVLRNRSSKIFYATAALLVSLSTVTAREHYLLDVVGGAALAGAAYAWWRQGPATAGEHKAKRRG